MGPGTVPFQGLAFDWTFPLAWQSRVTVKHLEDIVEKLKGELESSEQVGAGLCSESHSLSHRGPCSYFSLVDCMS